MRRRDFLSAAVLVTARGCMPLWSGDERLDSASTADPTAEPTRRRDEQRGPTRRAPDTSRQSGDTTNDSTANQDTANQDTANNEEPVADDNGASREAQDEGFPPPDALWFATHSTSDPLDDWDPHGGDGGFPNSGAARHENSSDVAHSGTQSLKMTIDTSSQKSGVRAHRYGPEVLSNREQYFSVWRYYPRYVAVSDWWNNMQIKSRLELAGGGVRNDPHFVLNITNAGTSNKMFYYLSQLERYLGGENKWHHQTEIDVPIGRWFNVEWHVVQSTGSRADGRVQIWQDGVELWDLQGVKTRHPGAEMRWGVTNYAPARGLNPRVATTYADDAAITRTRLGG